MQSISVKENDRPSFYFYRNDLFLSKIGYINSIYIRILRIPIIHSPPDKTFFIRSWNKPKASIFHSGVINGYPRAYQGTIPCWNKIFILVPCLSGFTGSLYKKHGLHAFYVRTYNVGKYILNAVVRQIVIYYCGYLVGEMDGHVFLQHFRFGFTFHYLNQTLYFTTFTS